MKLAKINLAEIDWNFNSAWEWPMPVKISVIALSCMAVAGGAIYYDTIGQLAALGVAEKKEIELKKTFVVKHNQSENLPEYQNQIKQIKQKLLEIIKQMPMEEEISGLLIDISQTGVASGLEFKLFKPAPPVRQDFYSELPINLEVVGKYEELCSFISGLASLPRIVTIHDLTIVPADKTKLSKQSNMLMTVLVKTYRENGNSQNDIK
ncbi:MAG: type 4a pilus biogenesis protein PilO [Methylococcaceae bacterium]